MANDAGDTVIVMRAGSFRWAPDQNGGSQGEGVSTSDIQEFSIQKEVEDLAVFADELISDAVD